MALLMGVEMCLVLQGARSLSQTDIRLEDKDWEIPNLPIFILQPQGSVPVVTFQ